MQHDYIRLLIKSAQQGKKNAYRELCEINLKKIFNMAVRFIHNKVIAEEITQNIFIEAWENLKFLREDQSFEVWLKSIAVYKILDELRTNKIKDRLFEEELISEKDFEIHCTDKFENLILSLPEKERIAFILHEIEEYTYAEISDFINDMSQEQIKEIIRNTRRSIIDTAKYE
jgi:RNA polymerase sigma-70 factor (ECF subfamily)